MATKRHIGLWGSTSIISRIIGASIITLVIAFVLTKAFILQDPIHISDPITPYLFMAVFVGFSGNITGLLIGGVSLVRLKNKPVSIKRLSKTGIIVNSLFIIPVLFSSGLVYLLFG